MSNTILVTGVTNFLGYHFARTFAGAGYDVVGTHHTPVERMEPGRRGRRDELQAASIPCHPLDVTDANAVREAIAEFRPRIWIQQAGLGSRYWSEDYDLSEANRINVMPLDAVYRGMAGAGGAVLITGSSMEYGHADSPHSEDGPCWPQSPYGLARLTATLRARQLAFRHRVPTRVGRVYTVFGEFDSPDRFVALLFERLRNGEKAAVAPGVARDICDVADVAAGYLRMAADCTRGPLFDIFNLSRGTATVLYDFALLVARQLKVDSRLVIEDPSTIRHGELPAVYGDNRRALVRLGWSPRPIMEGLARLARGAPLSPGFRATEVPGLTIVATN
jgi:nucleoside-diphosphate-sugar epimerase